MYLENIKKKLDKIQLRENVFATALELAKMGELLEFYKGKIGEERHNVSLGEFDRKKLKAIEEKNIKEEEILGNFDIFPGVKWIEYNKILKSSKLKNYELCKVMDELESVFKTYKLKTKDFVIKSKGKPGEVEEFFEDTEKKFYKNFNFSDVEIITHEATLEKYGKNLTDFVPMSYLMLECMKFPQIKEKIIKKSGERGFNKITEIFEKDITKVIVDNLIRLGKDFWDENSKKEDQFVTENAAYEKLMKEAEKIASLVCKFDWEDYYNDMFKNKFEEISKKRDDFQKCRDEINEDINKKIKEEDNKGSSKFSYVSDINSSHSRKVTNEKEIFSNSNIFQQLDQIDTAAFESKLNKKIHGQEKAVSGAKAALDQIKLYGKRKNKPIAAMLFDGPTGVGKTELVKAITDELDTNLIRVDFGSLSGFSIKSFLGGAAAPWSGHEKETKFVTDLKRFSKSGGIILLDEIEKAVKDSKKSGSDGTEAIDVFLEMLDEGKFTDAKGEEYDLSNFMIIATTNATGKIGSENGASKKIKVIGFGDRYDEKSSDKPSKLSGEEYIQELQKTFTPEFLGRFSNKIRFNTLTPDAALKILKDIAPQKAKEFAEKQRKDGLFNRVGFMEKYFDYIINNSLYQKEGARSLKNKFEESTASILIETLKTKKPRHKTITLDAKDGEAFAYVEDHQK